MSYTKPPVDLAARVLAIGEKAAAKEAAHEVIAVSFDERERDTEDLAPTARRLRRDAEQVGAEQQAPAAGSAGEA